MKTSCINCFHHSGGFQGECRKRSPERGEGSNLLRWPPIAWSQTTLCGDHKPTTCKSTFQGVRCMASPMHDAHHAGISYEWPAELGRIVLWDYLGKPLQAVEVKPEEDGETTP